MYMCHHYINTEIHDTIIACSWTTDTEIRYYTGYRYMVLCAQLLHVLTSLLHRLTDIHALVVSVFLLYGSLFILLLHEYSCIPLHDCFPLLISIFSLLVMWVVDMWCVELSATWIQATGPPLQSHTSYFPFPIILFHAIKRAHVLLSCYMHHTLYLFLIHCVV